MNRAVLLMMALCTLIVPPAPAAAEALATDWVVVTVTSTGGEISFVNVVGTIKVVPDASSPAVIGIGTGYEHLGSSSLFGLNRGPTSIDLMTGDIQISRTVAPAVLRSDAYGVGSAYIFGGSPMSVGESVTVLFFLAGLEVDDISIDVVDVEGGTSKVDIERGAGSRIVAMPEAEGTYIALGNLGAGSVTEKQSMEVGIAGAYLEDGCQCRGTWSSPSTSGWFNHIASGANSGTFAGPEGLWDWSWEGVRPVVSPAEILGDRATILAAYAPVGVRWPAFADTRS